MKKDYNIEQFEKAKLNELKDLANAFPIDFDEMEKEFEELRKLPIDDPRIENMLGEPLSDEEYQKLLNRPGEVSNHDIRRRM